MYTVLWLRFFLPWLKFFRAFSSVVRHIQGKTRKDGARPALFHISLHLCCSVVICVVMCCLCVNVYCHRVTTQLRLINISYHLYDNRITQLLQNSAQLVSSYDQKFVVATKTTTCKSRRSPKSTWMISYINNNLHANELKCFYVFYVLTVLCCLHAIIHPPTTINKWRQNLSQHCQFYGICNFTFLQFYTITILHWL
jgi:hypothetical protein